MAASATAKRSVSKAKPAAKAAAKPAAKAAKSAAANGNVARRTPEETLNLAKSIKAMREAEKTWEEIQASLGVDPAQGQYLIKVASVRPKDRLKYENDEQLTEQALALRSDGLSKAEIAARAGVSVGRIRSLLAGKKDPKPVAVPKAKAKVGAKPAGKVAPKAKATAAAKADAPKAAPAARKRRRRAEVAQDPSNAA
jgi:hypothetical protein